MVSFEADKPRIEKSKKIALWSAVGLVALSLALHGHSTYSGLHQELAAKAPQLFKVFLGGETAYFAGMALMALGLGSHLGYNPMVWKRNLQAVLASESQSVSRSSLFWLGLILNALGALTFSAMGIYVTLYVLPHARWSLILATVVDIGFSLFARWIVYRRVRRP